LKFGNSIYSRKKLQEGEIMSWYKDFKLAENDEGFCLEIYLNPEDTEFSGEFLSNIKENLLSLDDQINALVEENFSNIKINSIKLLVGAIVVGTIPFAHGTRTFAATATTTDVSTTTQATTVAQINTTGTVLADVLNVRTGPGTTYSIISKLWMGNQVHVVGETNGWYKVILTNGTSGFVSKTYIKLELPTPQQKIDSLLSVAQSLVGTPYVWGGESLQEGGFDCSGFTQYVFKQVGYSLNRISVDQATQGIYVSKINLQPGDLIFFSLAGDGRISHVGLYLGNGKMIHSPKTGDFVKITDITTSYWQTRIITARRIIF
jgi:cell wall-associated NlpC family hydrolase